MNQQPALPCWRKPACGTLTKATKQRDASVTQASTTIHWSACCCLARKGMPPTNRPISVSASHMQPVSLCGRCNSRSSGRYQHGAQRSRAGKYPGAARKSTTALVEEIVHACPQSKTASVKDGHLHARCVTQVAPQHLMAADFSKIQIATGTLGNCCPN